MSWVATVVHRRFVLWFIGVLSFGSSAFCPLVVLRVVAVGFDVLSFIIEGVMIWDEGRSITRRMKYRTCLVLLSIVFFPSLAIN